ncbi:hypothetical protein SVAN01_04723 [Stagonosporopsis vannaccii]|nr:hypothetical protein SVAN01_04723 [Stagonosporopsis vannaccii]
MTIFASKAVFMQLGVEQVMPSTAHMYQDCYICKDPLNVNVHTITTEAHHQAVRVSVCGHMYGQECLSAWLDVGNSCPTCKRMLFEATGRSISQADIDKVLRVLRRYCSEARAMSAIARLMEKQALERVQLRRTHEEDLEKTKAKEQSRLTDMMEEAEWMESGDEEDFDAEDDDTKPDVTTG